MGVFLAVYQMERFGSLSPMLCGRFADTIPPLTFFVLLQQNEGYSIDLRVKVLGASDALDREKKAMGEGGEASKLAWQYLEDEVHRLLRERKKRNEED